MFNFSLDEISIYNWLEGIECQVEGSNALDLFFSAISLSEESLICVKLTGDFYKKKLKGGSVSDYVFNMRTENADLSGFRDELLQLAYYQSRISEYNVEDFLTDENIDLELSDCELSLSRKDFYGVLTDREENDFSVDRDRSFVIFNSGEEFLAVRFLLSNVTHDESVFWDLSSLAFSNIYFVEGLKFRSLGCRYNAVKEIVIKHLSYLSDFAQSKYIESDEPGSFIKHASSHDVELSPESSKTHSNSSAKSQRSVSINEVEVLCEWHTKLYYNSGRIHFHFGLNMSDSLVDVTNGRLVVGIFAVHLDT